MMEAPERLSLEDAGEILPQRGAQVNAVPQEGMFKRFARGFLENTGPLYDAADAMNGNAGAAYRVGQGLYDTVVQEPGRVANEIKQSWNSPDMAGGAYHGISAVPLYGPQFQQIMDKAHAGDYAGALGNVSFLGAQSMLSPEARDTAGAGARVAETVVKEAPSVAKDFVTGGYERAASTPFKWGGRGTLGGATGAALGYGFGHSLDLPYYVNTGLASAGAGLGSKVWPFLQGGIERARSGIATKADIASKVPELPYTGPKSNAGSVFAGSVVEPIKKPELPRGKDTPFSYKESKPNVYPETPTSAPEPESQGNTGSRFKERDTAPPKPTVGKYQPERLKYKESPGAFKKLVDEARKRKAKGA